MKLEREPLEKRFRDLVKQRDAIRAKADPMRAARDKAAKRYDRLIADHNKKVQNAEKGLFDIEMEIGMIARALNNRVGEPSTEA